MAVLYYWTGTSWAPISSGGGDGSGAPGPQGPPGKDGESVEVYGPQAPQPAPNRKGDVWLEEVARGVGAANDTKPLVTEASPPRAASVTVIGLAYSEPVKVVPLRY